MCLTGENFQQMELNYQRWEQKGLPIEEARDCLGHAFSTVYPIAENAARFIYKHWSESQIEELGERALRGYRESLGELIRCNDLREPA